MKDYVVVQIAHRQYIVEPGKTYTVDRFGGDAGSKIDLPVLAVAKEGEFSVGDKLKAIAKVEIVDQTKGEKIRSFVYKAKSRYRRRYGKRKLSTTFKVLEIK
jgi:large subunit ribosomal protein L21